MEEGAAAAAAAPPPPQQQLRKRRQRREALLSLPFLVSSSFPSSLACGSVPPASPPPTHTLTHTHLTHSVCARYLRVLFSIPFFPLRARETANKDAKKKEKKTKRKGKKILSPKTTTYSSPLFSFCLFDISDPPIVELHQNTEKKQHLIEREEERKEREEERKETERQRERHVSFIAFSFTFSSQ